MTRAAMTSTTMRWLLFGTGVVIVVALAWWWRRPPCVPAGGVWSDLGCCDGLVVRDGICQEPAPIPTPTQRPIPTPTQRPAAKGESCSGGRACALGLTCAQPCQICVGSDGIGNGRDCSTGCVSCPAGQVCSGGRCSAGG